MSLQLTVSDLEELKWYIMERPVLRFNRVATNNTDFEEVLSYRLPPGILGLSRLLLSLNTDPEASYRIQIGTLFNIEDSPICAVFNIDLPHLDNKVYVGLNPGDFITIMHRSPSGTTIISEAFLELNEVYLDPNFWEKVIRKARTCESVRTPLTEYVRGEIR